MSKTKIVFFGSPRFSAEILTHLIHNDQYQIVAVVTNPDRPVGRHQTLTPSPVAQVATEHHLPTFKPNKLDEDNLMHISLLKPDLFITAAFGKIVPDIWLKAPRIKCLNIHFSLLPKYRGALCVSEPIKNLDHETGVTLMEMDSALDHGPIIAQIAQKIDVDDNVETLLIKLTDKANHLLDEALPRYLEWSETHFPPAEYVNLHSIVNLPPIPQEHDKATFTPATSSRTRANALVPWEEITLATNGNHPEIVHALIRSLNPDPGAWTQIIKDQDRLDFKLVKTKVHEGRLEIEEIQVPGKPSVSWKQFLAGHPELK